MGKVTQQQQQQQRRRENIQKYSAIDHVSLVLSARSMPVPGLQIASKTRKIILLKIELKFLDFLSSMIIWKLFFVLFLNTKPGVIYWKFHTLGCFEKNIWNFFKNWGIGPIENDLKVYCIQSYLILINILYNQLNRSLYTYGFNFIFQN